MFERLQAEPTSKRYRPVVRAGRGSKVEMNPIDSEDEGSDDGMEDVYTSPARDPNTGIPEPEFDLSTSSGIKAFAGHKSFTSSSAQQQPLPSHPASVRVGLNYLTQYAGINLAGLKTNPALRLNAFNKLYAALLFIAFSVESDIFMMPSQQVALVKISLRRILVAGGIERNLRKLEQIVEYILDVSITDAGLKLVVASSGEGITRGLAKEMGDASRFRIDCAQSGDYIAVVDHFGDSITSMDRLKHYVGMAAAKVPSKVTENSRNGSAFAKHFKACLIQSYPPLDPAFITSPIRTCGISNRITHHLNFLARLAKGLKRSKFYREGFNLDLDISALIFDPRVTFIITFINPDNYVDDSRVSYLSREELSSVQECLTEVLTGLPFSSETRVNLDKVEALSNLKLVVNDASAYSLNVIPTWCSRIGTHVCGTFYSWIEAFIFRQDTFGLKTLALHSSTLRFPVTSVTSHGKPVNLSEELEYLAHISNRTVHYYIDGNGTRVSCFAQHHAEIMAELSDQPEGKEKDAKVYWESIRRDSEKQCPGYKLGVVVQAGIERMMKQQYFGDSDDHTKVNLTALNQVNSSIRLYSLQIGHARFDLPLSIQLHYPLYNVLPTSEISASFFFEHTAPFRYTLPPFQPLFPRDRESLYLPDSVADILPDSVYDRVYHLANTVFDLPPIGLVIIPAALPEATFWMTFPLYGCAAHRGWQNGYGSEREDMEETANDYIARLERWIQSYAVVLEITRENVEKVKLLSIFYSSFINPQGRR